MAYLTPELFSLVFQGEVGVAAVHMTSGGAVGRVPIDPFARTTLLVGRVERVPGQRQRQRQRLLKQNHSKSFYPCFLFLLISEN